MSLKSDTARVQAEERLRGANERLERSNAQLRAEVQATAKENATLRERAALLDRALAESGKVLIPPWAAKPKPSAQHRGTPGLLFSDQHYDEVVDPAQVEGLNAFNREIAVVRTQRLFERTVLLARSYLTGVSYDGFLLMLGGDTFSGNIHDELTETNEDTVFGSLLFWSEQLAGFIGGLADEFKKVHVLGVAGNHGRMTRKPRAKFYARDNLDWLLYRMLERDLRRDARVTWNIPDSRDAEVCVYDTRIRLTHGDQARGGSGISGKRTPLALLEHRKTRRVMQAGQLPYDVMAYGHWHEYDPGERLLGNGSLKGIDEYALGGEFGMEPPKQAFFLITPEHKVSLKAPVFCGDRKREKW